MGNSSSSAGQPRDGSAAAPAPARRPSYYSLLKNSYQALVHAIIRPPRSIYDAAKLGPATFPFCGKTFKRTDFTLVNPREQRICCSLWEPIDADRACTALPCVVYMHGNSSSRLEGLAALSLVLGLGATLLSFDFAGSGHSDGEYVSLGAFEKDDLQCVIEYLRASGGTSTIALWGRSMGAATALLHGERDPSIAAMVLDSAFSSLVTLSEEMVEMGRKQGLFAPGFIVRMALQFVRSSVQKTAGFDITKLTPIESADKCFIPAMFIAAEDDHFVNKSHSEAIHERYGGDKNLVVVEGDHNSARPKFLYDSIGIFLTQTLQLSPDWMLPDSHLYIRRLPWTFKPAAAGYNASVTSVGSRHQQLYQHPHPGSSAGGATVAAPRSGGGGSVWSDVPGGGGVESESQKMSFDEMLALSIALNEEEDEDYGDSLGGQPNIFTDVLGGSFGADFGGENFGAEDAELDEMLTTNDDAAAAERAMQQDVQGSLFNLMNVGVGGAGKTPAPAPVAVPPAPPLPVPAPASAPAPAPVRGMSAVPAQPPQPPRAESGTKDGRSVFVNPITKRSHSLVADTASWRCSACAAENVTGTNSCSACGTKR